MMRYKIIFKIIKHDGNLNLSCYILTQLIGAKFDFFKQGETGKQVILCFLTKNSCAAPATVSEW